MTTKLDSQKRYEQRDKLPAGAKTVKLYAADKGISTSHVYKLYNQGTVEIIVYQGINFVIPA